MNRVCGNASTRCLCFAPAPRRLTPLSAVKPQKQQQQQRGAPLGCVGVDSEVETKKPTESKNLETMRKFSVQYAQRTKTYFCTDKSVTSVVIQGLAEHKDTLGAPLCPCRHYDDKKAEAAQGFWNCPCVPMRERKECHCMLFLTTDNDFAGKDQDITIDEIREGISGMQ